MIEAEVNRVIAKDKKLLDLKRNEFKRGKRPDGSIIGTYRSLSYRRKKQSQNPMAGGFVDLFRTGAFSRGLFIQKLSSRKYNFFSTDKKAPELFAKYGKGTQGLNGDTFLQRQREYMPVINRALKARLGI